VTLPVLDQGDTSACTGFALANVVNYLLRRAKREPRAEVSPFMLYSMARRYDEFPGARADVGSSLRGAMKGWYRHGSCAASLWTELDMPEPHAAPQQDWGQDAARRPLGAYYRIDTRSVTDMHAALGEAGVLYASALSHAGWDEASVPAGKRRLDHPAAPPTPAMAAMPRHRRLRRARLPGLNSWGGTGVMAASPFLTKIGSTTPWIAGRTAGVVTNSTKLSLQRHAGTDTAAR
jgi:hypothetical protein